MKYLFYLFFHCFLFFTVNTFSQNVNYQLNNISTIKGLSQGSVIAIHQDSFGQMWLGTRDGLNKYDGSNFKIYRNSTSDSLTISNNDILSIEEDNMGNLWVGTYKGLNIYNPKTDSFKRFSQSNKANSIANNSIWCIKEINNEIWFGTANGLSIYNKKTKEFSSFFHKKTNENSLNGNHIKTIFDSKNGTIWIGTRKGLCKVISRKNNRLIVERIVYFDEASKRNQNLFIQSCIEDEDLNLWVGTKTKGLFCLKNNTNKLISINNYKNLDYDIRALGFDKQKRLWIGSYDGVSIMRSNNTFFRLNYKENEYSSFSKIKSIYTDIAGSVWIGTYYGGVNVWNNNAKNFNSISKNGDKNKLGFDVVSSIVSDGKKNIYVGTEGGGVSILDIDNENTSYINRKTTKGLVSDNIKSLLLSDNDLWIGAFLKGISIYNLKSKRVDNSKLSAALLEKIKNSSIYVIEKEKQGVYWIGTFGEGLIRYDSEKNSIFTLENEISNSNSISNNGIRRLLIDSKKRVWVGTQSGLNVFNLKDAQSKKRTINRFFYEEKLNSGVDILTVFEDSFHNIWVGTKAKGIYLFKRNSFEKIEIVHNNTEITTIHSIVEDKNKTLWLSTNHGIVNYNPFSLETKIYNETDGLLSNEFIDNSGLFLDSNSIYFGGPEGIAYFNPDKISTNTYAPKVLLTDLKIKNESVLVNGEDGILEKSITFTEELKLDYNQANFSINFSIPNFINASKNQYSYRLVGLDSEWIFTKNNEVNYTIQNPGTYVFEVKGANNDGVWNETPTTLKIIVKPAPWRSWWAFTLYTILIGVALLVLILFLKSKARLRHELELEHIENIRIEEVNQSKLQFFTNISHEFRTPLTLILGPLQQILSEYEGSFKMHKKLLVIENSANHLLDLINQLMDFRKLEKKQFTLQAAEGNIVKFLKEIYLSFTEFSKDGDYTYTFNSDFKKQLIYFDRPKLERVFYNLISNSFRYTPKGGDISINISVNNDYFIVEVEDSGIGIEEEYIDKIFDRFFEIPTHKQAKENYNKGAGIGLSIAKNIVNLHKGTIEVKNKPTGGVIFKVSLPLGNKHLLENEILKDFKISDDISQYESQIDKSKVDLDEKIDDLVIEDSKPMILVVEDNKALRSFIKNLLNKEYNIIEAENGEVAYKKAIEYLPNLIISDVIMPKMVGTELCAKIKQNIKTSYIPIILLTARTSLIYKFEGLESGADEYISKPFNLKEFKLKIKNLLDTTERLKVKFSSEDNLMPNELTLSSIDEKLLKKAFFIVETNIENEQFDIPFFSSELGVSRSTLFSKIKAWTNFTPNEFIHEIRMKRAAQLLEQSKINISQVCYQIGFKNPKYFTKCFQKKYGMTPSQFRNKFSENYLEEFDK